MTATIRLYEFGAAPEGAKVALAARLFVPTWTLQGRLEMVAAGMYRSVVAVAYRDDVPVAVVLVRCDPMRSDVAAFVRHEARRQGIGRSLVEAIAKAGHVIPVAETGITGSEYFWRKAGVRCPWNTWPDVQEPLPLTGG